MLKVSRSLTRVDLLYSVRVLDSLHSVPRLKCLNFDQKCVIKEGEGYISKTQSLFLKSI